MLATVLAASPIIRGHEHTALDLFAVGVALTMLVLWVVAANSRMRREA